MKQLFTLLFHFLIITVFSQNFSYHVVNPFGLAGSSAFATPAFADIDHDGDLDLFVGAYTGDIHYFENTGTPLNPVFASNQTNPFGLTGSSAYATPAFADIDHDGDLDLFVGAYTGDINYFRNTGTPANPVFASNQTNPFGLSGSSGYATPVFADIDYDGDLDLFVGAYTGSVYYFKNTGTRTNPSFSSYQVNPFGFPGSNAYSAPAFSDIDHDGDLDLFVGTYEGNINYFKNTGSLTNPAFASQVTNPFGFPGSSAYAAPAFADIDYDGDDDLFLGAYTGDIHYFKNNDNTGILELKNQPIRIFPNPTTGIISLNTIYPVKKIEVLDIEGVVVYAKKSSVLDLSDQKPGIYLIRIFTGKEIFTGKIVLEE